jgi:hypothetical protein
MTTYSLFSSWVSHLTRVLNKKGMQKKGNNTEKRVRNLENKKSSGCGRKDYRELFVMLVYMCMQCVYALFTTSSKY